MTTAKAREPEAVDDARLTLAGIAVAAADIARNTLSVQAALALIIGEMPAIGKDQQMGTGQYGYAYRGIEQITTRVQPLLAKHGVVIVPQATLLSISPAHDQKPGWQDTVLQVDWTIVGPDGSMLTATTIGVGRDNSDKGANKAMSQAFKYLLLQLLCISDSKDDADGHSYDSAPDAPTQPDPDDPAVVLFEMVKATKGTPMEQGLKDLAERNERKLSPKAFADDADWSAVVHTFITGEETNG